MKTVYKFPVARDNEVTYLAMPVGALVLHGAFQVSSESLAVWVEVDTDAAIGGREVIFLGTGRKLPDGQMLKGDWRFVNTFLMQDAGLVFHVYERSAEF
jgi:hypothetical protein